MAADTLREARDRLWAGLGYIPTPAQREAHDSPARYKIVAGGERAGKSYCSAKELLWWIIRFQLEHMREHGGEMVIDGSGLWWIVGPTYDLARPEAMYLIEDLSQLGLISNTKRDVSIPARGAVQVRLPFGKVETRSADDVMKIAGYAPDGILVCETAQLSYEAWLKVFGRAAQKRAPIWASGTFERSSGGWYSAWWERWRGNNQQGGASFSLPSWSNIYIYPNGRDDEQIRILEATYPPDLFMERFGAVPAKNSCLVFPEFDPTRHVVPMELGDTFQEIVDESGFLQKVILPRVNMEVWVDPGVVHPYVVLAVMRIGEKVYIYDEVYVTRTSARDVIATAKKREWWPLVRYGIIDLAGKQHHEGYSHKEIWEHEGGIPMYAGHVAIIDGIERHHSFLLTATGEVRLYHNTTCVHTIEEYGKYRYPEGADGKYVRDKPIDLHNDAMKAIAYGLIYNYGTVKHEVDLTELLWESPFGDWEHNAEDMRLPVELRG